MRRFAFLGILVTVGYVAYWSRSDTPTSPVIITPSVVDSPPPPEPVGEVEEVGATDVTSAKAEVQSLTWQLDLIKEQLAEAQAKVENSLSVESEEDTPAVYRSSPRGHYEWRRVGLFRRKKVWVNQ